MKYQLFYIIVAFLSFTACKDDYECTTYQMDGKGEALPIKVELLEEVVKSDVDYYAKNTPYTLCLDEKDREVFSYSDSSILAKVGLSLMNISPPTYPIPACNSLLDMYLS